MNPDTIEADFLRELLEIQAESIGWIPLEEGVYLHEGDESATEVLIVGLARADMQSSNVLWMV